MFPSIWPLYRAFMEDRRKGERDEVSDYFGDDPGLWILLVEP